MRDVSRTLTFKDNFEAPSSLTADTTLLSISGWVFCCEAPIRALQLKVADASPVTVAYGVPRADVAAVHANTGSLKSGFGIQVPVQIGTSSQITLTLIALLDDGRGRFASLVRIESTGRAVPGRCDARTAYSAAHSSSCVSRSRIVTCLCRRVGGLRS